MITCDVESIAVEFAHDLTADGDEMEYEAARTLFRGWMSEALAFCNRSDVPDAMVSVVRGIATAAYNRRGDEGATSSSVGGQSMAYEDLGKEMRSRLIGAGLRVYRI